MEHTPRNLAHALHLAGFDPAGRTALPAVEDRFLRLVPYELWLIATPLIRAIESQCPSGRRRTEPLPIFAALIYVMATGRAWTTQVPKDLCSATTLKRRYAEWTAAGFWQALCAEVTTRHGQRHDLVTWATVLVEAAAEHPANPRLLPSADRNRVGHESTAGCATEVR